MIYNLFLERTKKLYRQILFHRVPFIPNTVSSRQFYFLSIDFLFFENKMFKISSDTDRIKNV